MLILGFEIELPEAKQLYAIVEYKESGRQISIKEEINKKALLLNHLQVFLDAKLLTGERIIIGCDSNEISSMEGKKLDPRSTELNRKLRFIGQMRRKLIINNIVHEDGEKWLAMNQFQATNWDYFDNNYPCKKLKRKFNFDEETINPSSPLINKKQKTKTTGTNKSKNVNWTDCKMDSTFFESFVLDDSLETSMETETIILSDSDEEKISGLTFEENPTLPKMREASKVTQAKTKNSSCQTTGKYTTIASNADQIIQELVEIIKKQNENHQDSINKILTHTSIGLEAVKKFMHYGILQVLKDQN